MRIWVKFLETQKDIVEYKHSLDRKFTYDCWLIPNIKNGAIKELNSSYNVKDFMKLKFYCECHLEMQCISACRKVEASCLLKSLESP